jgi:hypothetical protein
MVASKGSSAAITVIKEPTEMKNKKEWGLAASLVLGLIFVLTVNANLRLKAEKRELSKAVFIVA